MIGNRNKITKRLDFEERVLIGWLTNTGTGREPANQDANLIVQHLCLCIYLKVVYHFRLEYDSALEIIDYLYYGQTRAMFDWGYKGLEWKNDT